MIFFSPIPARAGDPSKFVITIEKVELKNADGRWVTVIEPDKQVDLVAEAPTVAFFNNNGRVPPGRYDNFRVTLSNRAADDFLSITGKKDFAPPIDVKRGSFIRIEFGFDLAKLDVSTADTMRALPSCVQSLRLTVDGRSEALAADAVDMTF